MQDVKTAFAAAMGRMVEHYTAVERRTPNRHERRAAAARWRRANTVIPSRKRRNLLRRCRVVAL